MATLPANVICFGYIFFTLELFTYGIVLGIACLNLVVIWPTKLLHSNLKCILFTQSIAVIFFLLIRSVMLARKFILNDPFVPAILTLQNFITFDAFFRRLLGHVLIIDRLLATFRANSYERFPKFYYNVAWFGITFAIAFVNTVSNGQSWTFTAFNVITQSFSTLLSLVEYLLIIVIGNYNQKKYVSQIEKASPNNYHIGKRYRVLDNMKTAKQLSPAFICLFLINLLITFFYISIATQLVQQRYQISLVLAGGVWIDAFFGAIIELTVITHHPLLKRRFVQLLKKIFCCRRNQIGELQTNDVEEMAIIGSKNKANETTEHFKILQGLWNSK